MVHPHDLGFNAEQQGRSVAPLPLSNDLGPRRDCTTERISFFMRTSVKTRRAPRRGSALQRKNLLTGSAYPSYSRHGEERMKKNSASTKPFLLGTRREPEERKRKAKVNNLIHGVRETWFERRGAGAISVWGNSKEGIYRLGPSRTRLGWFGTGVTIIPAARSGPRQSPVAMKATQTDRLSAIPIQPFMLCVLARNGVPTYRIRIPFMKVLISGHEKADIEPNSKDFLRPYPTKSVTWLGPTPS